MYYINGSSHVTDTVAPRKLREEGRVRPTRYGRWTSWCHNSPSQYFQPSGLRRRRGVDQCRSAFFVRCKPGTPTHVPACYLYPGSRGVDRSSKLGPLNAIVCEGLPDTYARHNPSAILSIIPIMTMAVERKHSS